MAEQTYMWQQSASFDFLVKVHPTSDCTALFELPLRHKQSFSCWKRGERRSVTEGHKSLQQPGFCLSASTLFLIPIHTSTGLCSSHTDSGHSETSEQSHSRGIETGFRIYFTGVKDNTHLLKRDSMVNLSNTYWTSRTQNCRDFKSLAALPAVIFSPSLIHTQSVLHNHTLCQSAESELALSKAEDICWQKGQCDIS